MKEQIQHKMFKLEAEMELQNTYEHRGVELQKEIEIRSVVISELEELLTF